MTWLPRFTLRQLIGLTVLVGLFLGWRRTWHRDRESLEELRDAHVYCVTGVDAAFESSYSASGEDRWGPPPWADTVLPGDENIRTGRQSATKVPASWLPDTLLPLSWSVQTIVVAAEGLSTAAQHHDALSALVSVKIVNGNLSAADLERLAALPAYRSLQLFNCHCYSQAEDRARVIGRPERPDLWSRLKLPTRLERLDLDGCTIDDAILKGLVSTIGSLKSLRCRGGRITDDFLEDPVARKSLGQLQSIDLTATDVTDLSVQRLAEIPTLEFVNLSLTRVTDAALAELEKLPRLRSVSVGATYVSEKKLNALRRARPKLEIASGAVTVGWLQVSDPEARLIYEPTLLFNQGRPLSP